MQTLGSLLAKVRLFEKEAHVIFGIHEGSRSRVVLLDETYKKLTGLSLQQDELFRQSLRCVENELFRAAHVMAWAGFMDFLEEKMGSDSFVKLRALRPKWTFGSLEDLRERVAEYQLIEAARDLGLCTKNEMKAFHGLLNKRNECAHPSGYYPGLNDSLGYITELINRLVTLQPKML